MAVSTRPAPAAPSAAPPPRLGALGWLRWVWRQLTSMRTALLLLLLLAVAAVPGTLLPQRGSDPAGVARLFRERRGLAEFLDALSLFDISAAPWFAAVYLALFTSLVGCLIPRTRQHLGVLRSRPPGAPARLDRLPHAERWDTALPAGAVLDAAERELRGRRFRVVRRGAALAAEKGYAKETGNLLFHAALLLVLAGIGLGSVFGWGGGVLLLEGRQFANTVTAYDEFTPGRLVDQERLAPFTLTLDDFIATFAEDGPNIGVPRSFAAEVTLRRAPTAPPERHVIRVNEPLAVGGAKVYLQGHGYAPRITVRDARGDVAFRGAVPFLPKDGNLVSEGVVKVPDARPEGIGLQGFFLPTFALDRAGRPVSGFPAPRDPRLYFTAFVGDLGLDSGVPQSVYRLDTSKMRQLRAGDRPFRAALAVGQSVRLPGGGAVTFDGYTQFASFSVARDPGKGLALGASVALLLGMLLMLLVRRRRVWVRATPTGAGRTVVEVAGLARSDPAAFEDEHRRLAAALRAALPPEDLPQERTT